jgi:hypothetical protein
MRLAIHKGLLEPLVKAGKQGLVAVQKTVTKNGKTFQQTFYVKAPNSTIDTPQHLQQPREKVKEDISGSNTMRAVYNRTDGFYIRIVQNDDSTEKYGYDAVRVPDNLIAKTYKKFGHTFIISPSAHILGGEDVHWGPDYTMTEMSTGMRVGHGNTVEDALDAGSSTLENKGKNAIQEAIDRAVKIKDIPENMATNGESWKVETPLTKKDVSDFAEKIWEEWIWTEGNKHDEIDYKKQIESWLSNTEEVESVSDLERIWDSISHRTTLERAIEKELTYEDSEMRDENIDKIENLLRSDTTLFNGSDLADYERIIEWEEEASINLTQPLDLYSYGVEHEDGEKAWASGDILAQAIQDNVSLDASQELAEESVKADLIKETISDIDITDSYGISWDYPSLQKIGAWVTGDVQGPRTECKLIDEYRRSGNRSRRPDDLTMMGVVESHMSQYIEGELFRGTTNHAWTFAKVGDVIPLGMASFSKSNHQANDFGDYILRLIPGEDEESRIMGVDIDDIIKSGMNEGRKRELDFLRITEYSDEKEVLVRAPSVEIVSVKDATAGYGKVFITVRPKDMDLVGIIKSKIDSDDRIKNMESTFDYSIHREPEGVFNE